MGNGFQFLDIILFALIAAFLVLRLRNVLGRRGGFGGQKKDPFGIQKRMEPDNENVVALPEREDSNSFENIIDLEPDTEIDAELEPQDALSAGLQQIRRADPSFEVEEFLVGARTAFEMIIDAYAAGDTETLQALLSRDVFANFADAIDKRETAGETLESRVSAIRVSDIVEAYIDGKNTCVTVKFVSDQCNVTRDAEGRIVEGDPQGSTEVTDFWTYARNIRARDPNWTLIATGSLD
jgi:predicted lipid-binding transport protein (Tim44 family)